MPSSRDEEWLLVKCDRTSHWKNKNLHQCLNTIRPEQSCWAHQGAPQTQDVGAVALDRPGTAIHALSMFVQQEHAGSQERTKIEGLAFARRVVAEFVEETAEEHLIKGLGSSHRDLRFSTEDERCGAVHTLLDTDGRSSWKFTAQELVPLLRRALDANQVEDKFVDTATAICARFPTT